jgi:hypothetical protein
MTIKELFEKSSEPLTLDMFEKFAKEGGAKFTDLSEGNYVSKDKFENEVTSKETQISQLNDIIKSRDKDLKDLKTQLKEAGTDSTKLAELQSNFDTLQTQYKEDTESYKKQLAEQAREFAVKEFAGTQKFSSNAAQRDFVNWLSSQDFKIDNNKIMGAEEYAVKYFEENPDAKAVEKVVEPKPEDNPSPKPRFSDATGGEQKPKTPSLSDLMKMKNDNPGTIINF